MEKKKAERLGLIEQVAILEPHNTICGLTIYRASKDESLANAFTSYAYAIATKALLNNRVEKQNIVTVSEAYRIITDRAKTKCEVTEAQKNYIRATVKADVVAIICNNEEEQKAKRIAKLWQERNAEVIIIEVNEFTERNTNKWTLSKYTEDERRKADNLARLYGISTSAPCYREPHDNDITMYGKRHDAEQMRRANAHATKVTTSALKYKTYFDTLASDKEIDDIFTYDKYITETFGYNTRSMFYDIDTIRCTCGKAISTKADTTETLKRTTYNICPYCGRRYAKVSPENIAFPEDILY